MKALINGINCAYTDEGKGMPVVFLHAFPLNRAMWAPQISAFTNHFRVITVDFRGHGESLPAPGPSSVDELALDLKGLLDHLAIPQAVFVGLSMGSLPSTVAMQNGSKGWCWRIRVHRRIPMKVELDGLR